MNVFYVYIFNELQICEEVSHMNRNQRDVGLDTVDTLLGETGKFLLPVS